MLMKPQVLRMLEYQDSVSHHDTDQADNAQDARQAEIDMERPQAQRRPEQGEQQRGQGRQRQADLLEIDQQEEENNDHGDRQALHQRVHRLEIQLLGVSVAAQNKGTAALTAQIQGGAVVELRGDGGACAQRKPGDGHLLPELCRAGNGHGRADGPHLRGGEGI